MATLAILWNPSRAADEGQTRLLRFPATNGTSIVFSYAGQLYSVPMQGGVARRLTDAPGYAIFPRFSADGAQLAFTAQYDGNTEVFVMPADGGVPKRLTYSATLGRDDVSDRMGPNNLVMAWKNTAPEIAFRSRMRSFNDFIGQLYTVGLDAEVPRQLPVPRGGFLSFSPDDTRMAYNQVFREFRTWKRYQGGMADDVWVFDFKTGAVENITNHAAQDIIPMWAPDNRVYFISDRTGRMNLYSYDLASRQTRQHTQFTDFDIKFPSLGRGGIVFEQAGYVWHFDLQTGQPRRVPITIKEDFASARAEVKKVTEFVSRVRPSPDGKRAVVVARGDVFSVPARNGAIRNLTNTPGVHERDASWSPDGRWIAYISDESGENELWIRPQDGKGAPQQLTNQADTYYYAPSWSPDSRKLLWTDRKLRLRFVDVTTREVTLVEQATEFEVGDRVWSPDSKWIAYVLQEKLGFNVANDYGRLRLYSVDQKQAHDVTDGWFHVNSPAFSEDGKHLLVASARDFKPTYGNLEFNHIYQDMERVYVFTLAKATESPLKPRSDEVTILADEAPAEPPAAAGVTAHPVAPASAGTQATKVEDAAAEGADANGKAEAAKKDARRKPPVVQVDLDGLPGRVVGLPITPSNYTALAMSGDKVFYIRIPSTEAADATRPRGSYFLYDLKERKETEILAGVTSAIFTADGKKVLISQRREHALIDAPSAKAEIKDKDKLDLSGLETNVEPVAEWRQIFHESWRQMRDFFYVENLHGVDWPAMRERYARLLPHVRHRNDLTYVIGEMIGELNVGHAYVGLGDRANSPRRIRTGLLGAEVSRDPASKAYRIDRILKGENWQDSARSPLTEIGVDVKEGDFILAVDGRPVRDVPNLFAALVGTAGRQVVLRVNARPVDEGARDVVVVPIADESSLYYHAWVQKNIAHVTEKTGGKVGYIHIPDMGPEGLNEFAKHFYPQLTRKALIIDVRGNGGGNVSAQVIERLRRQLVGWNVYRNSKPFANPDSMMAGPLVCLANEFSASDGDIFPFRFQTLGMGKVIGKRTWGGVVGIRGTLPFMDGGMMSRPEFTFYSVDGKRWQVEGIGVEPDIVVVNDPAREFKGEDQQLDRGIAQALEELKTKEIALPPPPPGPDRSR